MIDVETRGQSYDKHVTLTNGVRGWFAVMLHWNHDHGGFWEPWQSGVGSYDTPDEAEVEAKEWAEAEGVEYRRPQALRS